MTEQTGNTSAQSAASAGAQRRVAQLRVGDAVDGLFIVQKKLRREGANGNAFLLFRLADATGQINAVLWQGANLIDERVKMGDVARIRGQVHSHQNARQIKIARLDIADPSSYDEKTFLAQSPNDGEQQYARLLSIIESVDNEYLKRLYLEIFSDADMRRRFSEAPAGKGWHHAYVGGMLDHVLSMLALADLVAEQHPGLDRDLVIGGVLLHDVGKVFELSWDRTFEYTTEGRLVGHLVQGCILAAKHMDAIDGFPEDLRIRLLHTIVSHHGALDRGSPKEPMTFEAMAVHLLDHLDSQLHAISQVVEGSVDEEGWTEQIRLAKRSFYVGKGEAQPTESQNMDADAGESPKQ